MDGPLWRIYIQDYYPKDEPGFKGGLSIFKAHHSLCDGVSVMCMTLAMGESYARDFFVKADDAKWWEEILVKLTCFLYIPKMIWTTSMARPDDNFITRKK